jgi:hypothetical protein
MDVRAIRCATWQPEGDLRQNDIRSTIGSALSFPFVQLLYLNDHAQKGTIALRHSSARGVEA